MNNKITIQYIAGFFDADGSISLIKNSPNETKAPAISFHNTQKIILEDIQCFFKLGSISKKKKYKEHHSQCYSLKIVNRQALKIALQLSPHIRHPKKVHRINLIISDYLPATPRNGYYTEELKQLRRDFEDKFFKDFI